MSLCISLNCSSIVFIDVKKPTLPPCSAKSLYASSQKPSASGFLIALNAPFNAPLQPFIALFLNDVVCSSDKFIAAVCKSLIAFVSINSGLYAVLITARYLVTLPNICIILLPASTPWLLNALARYSFVNSMVLFSPFSKNSNFSPGLGFVFLNINLCLINLSYASLSVSNAANCSSVGLAINNSSFAIIGLSPYSFTNSFNVSATLFFSAFIVSLFNLATACAKTFLASLWSSSSFALPPLIKSLGSFLPWKPGVFLILLLACVLIIGAPLAPIFGFSESMS